ARDRDRPAGPPHRPLAGDRRHHRESHHRPGARLPAHRLTPEAAASLQRHQRDRTTARWGDGPTGTSGLVVGTRLPSASRFPATTRVRNASDERPQANWACTQSFHPALDSALESRCSEALIRFSPVLRARLLRAYTSTPWAAA